MTDYEFRCFLDLLMCSDPWPIGDGGDHQNVLTNLADKEAKKRNFPEWIEAYHKFKCEEK